MPELPILDASGQLSEAAGDILLAFMTYPEDEERREEFLACTIVQRYEDNPEALASLAGTMPWLVLALHRAPTPSGVFAEATQATGSAWIVGEILLMMLGAAIHHPEINVSITKTVSVLKDFHKKDIGERTLWDAWSTFRSVAHFYAVRRFWMYAHDDPTGELWEDWVSGDFDEYLSAAEELREMAVTRRFLPYESTWRVPKSLTLPSVGVELAPLEPDLLALFRGYRPEHSRR